MDPITAALIASVVSGGMGAIGSASQSSAQRRANRPQEQFMKRRNQLIDELLASLEGKGKFADFFKQDEETFKKTFVDPAKQMFSEQITPQIQQRAIAEGSQRSSSTEDKLARAGVDLDQMLAQNYASFQQQGQDRFMNMLSSILGTPGPGAMAASPTPASAFAGGAAGFLSSPAFAAMLQGSGGSSATKSPTQYTQGQRDMLNNPALMQQSAYQDYRPGYAIA